MSASVPLPHSKSGPYKGNYWGILEKDMKLLMKEATLTRMEEVILKYITRGQDSRVIARTKLENLRRVFSSESSLCLVPFMAHLVLQLPALFPGQGLDILTRGEQRTVTLTRSQVGSLQLRSSARDNPPLLISDLLPCGKYVLLHNPA